MVRLAGGRRLAGDADLRLSRLHAHGGRRRHLGGDGVRTALRPPRRGHRRTFQRQQPPRRPDGSRGRDLAGLGPLDHRESGPRNGSQVAPDRLDQPELADTRHLLPPDHHVRFGAGALLRCAGVLEICCVPPGGCRDLLHRPTAGREFCPGRYRLRLCVVHRAVLLRHPSGWLLEPAGGGLHPDPGPDQLQARALHLADRAGDHLLVQRPRWLYLRLHHPGPVSRLASDHAPSEALAGGGLQHFDLAGPLGPPTSSSVAGPN